MKSFESNILQRWLSLQFKWMVCIREESIEGSVYNRIKVCTTFISVVFNSDFVHTSCQKVDNISEIMEDFVHLQMWNAKDDGGPKIKSTTM